MPTLPAPATDPPPSSDAHEPIPHPSERHASLSFVMSDGPAEEPLVLKTTHVIGHAARKRLVGLANILTNVRHPNVVPLREVRITSAGVYAVADHIEGIRLSSLMDESRARPEGEPGVPVAVALRIALDILDGLTALHDAFARAKTWRIHGELAPAGMLVGVDGRTRLERLGGVAVAELRAHAPAGEDAVYCAPELWLRDEADDRADVFSAGVILWELVAGRRLFSGSRENILAAMVRGDVAMPGGSLRVGPELLALTRRALDPRPAQRFGSAYAFAQAVRALARRFSIPFTRDVVADYVAVRFSDDLHIRRAFLRDASSSRVPVRAAYLSDAYLLAADEESEPSGEASTTTTLLRPTTPAPAFSPSNPALPDAGSVVRTRTAPMMHAVRPPGDTTPPLSDERISGAPAPVPTRAGEPARFSRIAQLTLRASVGLLLVIAVSAALAFGGMSWWPTRLPAWASRGLASPPPPAEVMSSPPEPAAAPEAPAAVEVPIVIAPPASATASAPRTVPNPRPWRSTRPRTKPTAEVVEDPVAPSTTAEAVVKEAQ